MADMEKSLDHKRPQKVAPSRVETIAQRVWHFIALFICLASFSSLVDVIFYNGAGLRFILRVPIRVLPPDNRDVEPLRLNHTLTTMRYDIQTGYTTCYPESGGMWVAQLDALEMDFLGIDRFESSERSWEVDRESDFCEEVRVFGGSWYDIPPDLLEPSDEHGKPISIDLREWRPVCSIARKVGIMDGEIWVLRPGQDGRFPKEYKMVHNALYMDERCFALYLLGATFCPHNHYYRVFWEIENICDFGNEGACPQLDTLSNKT